MESLAEVAQQRRSAAFPRLGVARHRLQAGLASRPLRRRAFIDQRAAGDEIAPAEQQQAIGPQPIAARPADLLVVVLQALRQVVVEDEPHVGLVDPHAERDGRHHDRDLVAREKLLVVASRGVIHPRVVRQDGPALRLQAGRQLIHAAPRAAVDDARVIAVRFQEGHRLRRAIRSGPDFQEQVLPVVAGDERVLVTETERGLDVSLDPLRGRGRERDADRGRIPLAHGQQLPVLGPKIVPPLRDAVRLVNRQAGDPRAVEQHPRFGAHQRLRRRVEQLDLTGSDAVCGAQIAVVVQRAVQERRGHAELLQLRHLILHQGDQRRYDHGQAVEQQGGQLIAQRLAAAGRHHRQRVAAGEDVGDDVSLIRPEIVIPEDRTQQVAGGGKVWRVDGWHQRAASLRTVIARPAVLDEAIRLFWAWDTCTCVRCKCCFGLRPSQ